MQRLQFHPLLKRIRWGGTRLGSVLGKPVGPESDYAESWEIVDHGDDQSIVAAGEYLGWTLARLVAERGRELFGSHRSDKQFPLLVKFLDAADRLSVQVHPNDEQAQRIDPRENGKTEAWVILEVEPQSRLYAGLKQGVDRQRLQSAVENGTVEDCLHSFPVKPGDCVFIPAGTVHAIGEGILLAEIQQSSDVTFRLDDWGRLGSDGKPRALHVEQALACIDFERGPVDPVAPKVISSSRHRLEELVACEYFVMRRHTSASPFPFVAEDRLRVLMMLEGRATIEGGGQSDQFPRGQTVLLPAMVDETTIRPDGQVVVLEAFLP
ncbi:MAG: type I phosphomannose isomerase catalytic subunit [Planctomycetaceae bacterium]